MNYYEINANSFIENTLKLDLSDLYEKFLKSVPDKSKILDIGCGPGRDLKHFQSLGHTAIGLEPCEELAQFARSYSMCEVVKCQVQDYNPSVKFNAVWACASLLHLSTEDLISSLSHFTTILEQNGVLYCSFKYGEFEGERGGRFFNDQTLESFTKLLPRELEIFESWVTEDVRPERDEKWLNLLVRN
jgi:SAM-dependent methyltransferase